MKIAAAAFFGLMVAALFLVLQAKPSALQQQSPSPSSDEASRSVWDGVYYKRAGRPRPFGLSFAM